MLTTNDIGTWITCEDARLAQYTIAHTHGSPVLTLNLAHTRHKALVFDRWGAGPLGRQLLRFHHTGLLAHEPSGPHDYVI